MKDRRRSEDAVPMFKRRPVTSHSHQHRQADNNVQHKQESNDGVHEQDADTNNDDKEKQSPTVDKSHVTVSRNREIKNDGHRDSKRQKTVIHSHTSFQAAIGVSKCWVMSTVVN